MVNLNVERWEKHFKFFPINKGRAGTMVRKQWMSAAKKVEMPVKGGESFHIRGVAGFLCFAPRVNATSGLVQ